MDALTFLRRVLPSEGSYCVFAYKGTNEKPKQLFYGSIGDVVQKAQKFDADGYDTYYAVASFNKKRSRTVENINRLKAVFLDLDCGEAKPFKDKYAAYEALKRFCKKLNLPRPTVVDSGGGLHVYWVFTEALTYDEWLVVATKLKEACKAQDFHADHVITADAARVLRVPETHNYKTDPANPVLVMGVELPPPIEYDRFSELLGSDSIPVPEKKSVPKTDDPVMKLLLGNKRTYFKEILRKTTEGRGCAQLLEVYENPDEVSEPIWRDAISILKHCDDTTREHVHKMSMGYHNYTREETDKKYDNAKYVHLCTTFDEHNPDVCPKCPHWGKIRSPITLGTKIIEDTSAPDVTQIDLVATDYVVPKYPEPYFRGENGGIYLRKTTSDGDTEETLIYHNDLYVMRRIRDPILGESIVLRLHLPQDGVQEFTLPLTAVTARDEFRKELSKQGVVPNKMEQLMAYINAWVYDLQARCRADQAHTQFGWVDKSMESFILGDKQIYADSVDFNPPSAQTASLLNSFKPYGTMEGWKENLRFYDRAGMEMHQFIIGTAFGSVLMPLTPINSAILHIHSKDTGFGKTTAMLMGLTLWGNPKDLMLDDKDTDNSKLHRAEIYKNLPLYIDEVTETEPRALSAMAYALPTGKQRNRLASGANTERYRGMEWQLLTVTTGNASIIERINSYKAMPKAEAQRIIECRAQQYKGFSTAEAKKETDEFTHKIMNHYGVASTEYVQYIINHKEEVKQLWLSVQKRLDRQAGLMAENRFWSVAASATLTGLILAKQLNFISYDLKAVENWIVDLLLANRHLTTAMSQPAMTILSDFILENYGYILRVPSTYDNRKNPSDKDDKPVDNVLQLASLNNNTEKYNRIVGRYEPDTSKAYLVPKALRKWCTVQQINYQQLTDDLIAKHKAEFKKVRITKGTSIHMPPTQVLVVDCDPALLDSSSDKYGNANTKAKAVKEATKQFRT